MREHYRNLQMDIKDDLNILGKITFSFMWGVSINDSKPLYIWTKNTLALGCIVFLQCFIL